VGVNDMNVCITVELGVFHYSNAVDMEDFIHLMQSVLFTQLSALWNCRCDIIHRIEIRSLEIRVSCPALLARGVEDKIQHIVHNMEDRSVYEVDSYPQERRLNIATRPEDAMHMPRTDSFTPGRSAQLMQMYGEGEPDFLTKNYRNGGAKVNHIEVPPPEKKRIVKVDIK